MRWLLASAVLFSAVVVSAKPSNPAFLGVGMSDIGTGGMGPCQISQITPNSPAQSAGLEVGDILVSIDAAPIDNCNALLAKIQQHASGDTIEVRVRRHSSEPTLKATLISREEVLRRRGIVGQPVIATSLLAADGKTIDLSDAKKRTTIVGWFDASCVGCEAVFSKVAKWSTKHSTKASPIRVLAAVGENRYTPRGAMTTPEHVLEDLARRQRMFDVPLVLVDTETRDQMTLADQERIYFMVIDGRGIVQHVAPVSPSSEDAAAMLDEVFAMTEQCSRKLN